jgi:hypothetical protein
VCEGNTGIDGRGVNSGPESEVGDASRAGRNVRSDFGCDWGTQMVVESEANKIVHIKKMGKNRGANSSRFKGGIVGANRDMAEGSYQFS